MDYQSTLTIYNRDGVALCEPVGISATRAWIAGNVGTASFDVPLSDPNLTAQNFQFGNYVLIDHNRAGAWVGLLWSDPVGQQWAQDRVTFYAYSAEWLLKTRRLSSGIGGVYIYTEAMSAGQALELAIADINRHESTPLQAGSIDRTGPIHGWWFNFAMGMNFVGNLVRLSGYEWNITPDLSTGLLRLNVNWSQRLGTTWNYALEQGKNVEAEPGRALMTVQGPIVNECLARSTNKDDLGAVAIDDASRAAYGLSQSIVTPPGEAVSNEAAAAAQIALYAQPRKTYTVTATEDPVKAPDTFDHLNLGDVVWLSLPSVDFGGTNCQVRVRGKAWDDAQGKMALTLDKMNT